MSRGLSLVGSHTGLTARVQTPLKELLSWKMWGSKVSIVEMGDVQDDLLSVQRTTVHTITNTKCPHTLQIRFQVIRPELYLHV